MAAGIRAADLPEGSIVALWHDVALRNPDSFSDEILRRGGKVLRHGYAEDPP